MKTYLSGIRATGRLHLGNYLGAVLNFAKMQRDAEGRCLFFVADLHALTTATKEQRANLEQSTLDIAADYLAAGIDPKVSLVYAQSSVPEICEISTLLSMLQPLGALMRTPSFKEKARDDSDSVSLGLVSYPVLMAADILGPRATHVPVGPDQVAHLEMASRLARKLNRQAGTTIVPVPVAISAAEQVPGLRGGKMGKSEKGSSVPINATRCEVEDLYSRAAIDPGKTRRGDPGDPEACPAVFPIHRILSSEEELARVRAGCSDGSLGCADCKKSAARKVSDALEPFQEARARLTGDMDYVRDVLRQGAASVRVTAQETLELIRSAFGVRTF